MLTFFEFDNCYKYTTGPRSWTKPKLHNTKTQQSTLIIKLLKINVKEKSLKRSTVKKTHCIQRMKDKKNHRLLVRNFASQMIMGNFFIKSWKKKISLPRILYPVKISFKIEGKTNFLFKQKKLEKIHHQICNINIFKGNSLERGRKKKANGKFSIYT